MSDLNWVNATSSHPSSPVRAGVLQCTLKCKEKTENEKVLINEVKLLNGKVFSQLYRKDLPHIGVYILSILKN